MHYEVYVDSLFLLNFGMNLYVLLLVNQWTDGTATPIRIFLGAIAGGLGGLLPFLGDGPVLWKVFTAAFVGNPLMVLVTFPIRSFHGFLKLSEVTMMISMCMGGILTFCSRILQFSNLMTLGGAGILTIGGIIVLMIRRFLKSNKRDTFCIATMIQGKSSVRVMALIDSGNSLTEPISGKPVSVIDQRVFQSLWETGKKGYRVIPYRSVGKTQGIMEGYLLGELKIERNGVQKTFHDVYIAVNPEKNPVEEEGTASPKLILNPRLFEQES